MGIVTEPQYPWTEQSYEIRDGVGNTYRRMSPVKIHESDYGDSPMNFHVAKHGDTLKVDLTYPPYTDAENTAGKCRYVEVDQESVRASDGVRLHYDFDRDGFVIEQPVGPDGVWREVYFAASWALEPAEAES